MLGKGMISHPPMAFASWRIYPFYLHCQSFGGTCASSHTSISTAISTESAELSHIRFGIAIHEYSNRLTR